MKELFSGIYFVSNLPIYLGFKSIFNHRPSSFTNLSSIPMKLGISMETSESVSEVESSNF